MAGSSKKAKGNNTMDGGMAILLLIKQKNGIDYVAIT